MTAPEGVSLAEAREAAERVRAFVAGYPADVPDYVRVNGDGLTIGDLRALLAALPAEPAADARLAAIEARLRALCVDQDGNAWSHTDGCKCSYADPGECAGCWAQSIETALSGAAPAPRCQACTGGPDAGRGHTLRDGCAGAPQPDDTEPTCPCGETGPRCAAPMDCRRRFPAPQPAGEEP